MSQRVAIKVVKRKDVEATIHTTSPEVRAAVSENETKTERRERRELVSTVSSWVTERRERSRVEEIQALRKVFGDIAPSLSHA